MTHNTREVQPTESQALPHENIIKKCWKPDCRKVATCRDGSGWEWCDDHVDLEKTGSVLHTAQEYYDVDYYTALLKESFHHQLQKAREQAVLKGERRRIIEQIRVEERQKARQDWLREEIVRLEGMKGGIDDIDIPPLYKTLSEKVTFKNGHNQAIQTIIDRYHSELDQDTPCPNCDIHDFCSVHQPNK